MKQTLIRPIAIAFLAIALNLSSLLMPKQSVVFAQARGVLHHAAAGQRGRLARRRLPRKGAIGAGGAGTYAVRAKRRQKTVRRGTPIKRRTVWDDTDIAH